MMQCRHRPVHRAEIGDFRDATKFGRADLGDGRENRDHRVVDPDLDWAKLLLDFARRIGNGFGIGDVGYRNIG